MVETARRWCCIGWVFACIVITSLSHRIREPVQTVPYIPGRMSLFEKEESLDGCCTPSRQELLVNTLANVSKIFQASKISFVVVYGSALTLHRDSVLRDGDDDVDIMIKPSDVDRAADAFRTAIGYQVKASNVSMRLERPVLLSLGKDWAPLDIWVGHERNGVICIQCRVLQYYNACLSSDVYPTQKRSFSIRGKGVEVELPRNIETYLQFYYGSDWKVPKPFKGTQAPNDFFHQSCPMSLS
eukprot:TRINITY_DN10539_c1_g2_i1.p1 TRINITY_DN10539_c1_g2~~TRINITY_DN10539_c1_g2_i1.p1  ORF type:complete len:242 (+),score=22.15 TRINITY_DN10539_c1_g2_i1:80-805(+)